MLRQWCTIIVAAGNGQRFGGDVPKQYALLAGKPVLAHSLEIFAAHGPVVLVTDAAHAAFYAPLAKNFSGLTIAHGGTTRQESVQNGLNALQNNAPQFVMIHDAARPLVDADAITRLKAVVENGSKSATLAATVTDTLVRDNTPIDRTGVHAIQTPQAFDYNALKAAHALAAGKTYTDDTTLIKAENGDACTLVESPADNFKITTQADLDRAEKLIYANYADTRTGLGFDVHRFGDAPAGGTIKLFGADIPSDHCLVGHSDADAGLHAIADAILGTIGAGDIGVLFPPSDPQWKGMNSAIIVEKALALLAAKNGFLAHADIMLMAEEPRIGKHRDAITARLSSLLGLPADRIGLKATTTEKMGFIGRSEGLAVQAIVTVRIKR